MKTKRTKIKFVNREGKAVHLDGKLTLKQLLAMGVTHINIVKPEAPLAANEYRSTP